MQAIQASHSSARKCTPNILPCVIHHNGPINASKRYWSPELGEDGRLTSYFRGRKLRGREISLPDGYKGAIVKRTSRALEGPKNDATRSSDPADERKEEPDEPIRLLEEVATFDNMIVWGHEAPPEADDLFVKGVDEWVRFAEAIHSTSPGVGVKSEVKTAENSSRVV